MNYSNYVFGSEYRITSASLSERIVEISGSAGGASYAISASYALSASFAPSTPSFPFTGSALITGSLGVTGSVIISSGLTVSSSANIKGDSNTIGSAFRVESLSNTRVIIGNDGYHGLNTSTLGTTALTIEHPYPSPSNYFIADFKQSTTRFTLDTDGRMVWVGGKFTTYSDTSYIATFSNPANTSTGVRVSAAGSIHFFTSSPERVGKIGRKSNTSAGKLWYFAGANGGGIAGTAFHLFESDYGIATSLNYNSQFLQLNPPGITETATAVSSFKFLDIKTSSSINVDNPNHTIYAIDYNPTITSFNGSHYGLLVRPTTFNGIGLGNTLPSASLDIQHTNGYNQLRLRTQYTPTSTADANGSQGDICFDNNYMYYKTSEGWKRSLLEPF